MRVIGTVLLKYLVKGERFGVSFWKGLLLQRLYADNKTCPNIKTGGSINACADLCLRAEPGREKNITLENFSPVGELMQFDLTVTPLGGTKLRRAETSYRDSPEIKLFSGGGGFGA